MDHLDHVPLAVLAGVERDAEAARLPQLLDERVAVDAPERDAQRTLPVRA